MMAVPKDTKKPSQRANSYAELLRTAETLIELSSCTSATESDTQHEVAAETKDGKIISVTSRKFKEYKRVWRDRFERENAALSVKRDEMPKKTDRESKIGALHRACIVPPKIAVMVSKSHHKGVFTLQELLPAARIVIELYGTKGSKCLEEVDLPEETLLSTPTILLKLLEELQMVSYVSLGQFRLQKELLKGLGISEDFGTRNMEWAEIQDAILLAVQSGEALKLGKKLRRSYARFLAFNAPIKAACLALCVIHDEELLWENNKALYITASLHAKEEGLVSQR